MCQRWLSERNASVHGLPLPQMRVLGITRVQLKVHSDTPCDTVNFIMCYLPAHKMIRRNARLRFYLLLTKSVHEEWWSISYGVNFKQTDNYKIAVPKGGSCRGPLNWNTATKSFFWVVGSELSCSSTENSSHSLLRVVILNLFPAIVPQKLFLT